MSHLEPAFEHEVGRDRVEVHVRRVGAPGLEEEDAHRGAFVSAELGGVGQGQGRAASRHRAGSPAQAREIERTRDRVDGDSRQQRRHLVLPVHGRDPALSERAATRERVAEHRAQLWLERWRSVPTRARLRLDAHRSRSEPRRAPGRALQPSTAREHRAETSEARPFIPAAGNLGARPACCGPSVRVTSAVALLLLAAALDARGVGDDAFVARTLFSWTTEAQAAELSRTRRLLFRGASDGVSRSPYQRALDELGRDPGAIETDAALARLLTSSPELGARRYAWVTPYGTAIPRGQRSYGPVLVSMSLAPDALFARFAPAEHPAFRIVDAGGLTVDPSVVLSSPSRLASVLHVRADDPHGPYREIVVHGGVRCWSIGTAPIRARLDDDRVLLARLRRIARPQRALPLAPLWRTALPPEGQPRRWTARWARSMPFDTPRHRLSASVLTELERLLSVRLSQRVSPVEECTEHR